MFFYQNESIFLANIYLFKIKNRNTRKRCKICSKSAIKTSERHQRRSGVFMLTLIYFTPFSCASVVEFKQVNVNWVSQIFTKNASF